MNSVWCPKCQSDNTVKFGYGQWHCHDCGHFFEYWDREDQFIRDLTFTLTDSRKKYVVEGE